MAQWWQWILICRPDGIGYLLLFLMLFIHWKFPFNKTAIFFCLMTGIIAFFAKVYFVCGFAGIVLSYWIIHKNRKYAISFLILGGGLLIAAVVIANYLTNGLYYLITFEMESYQPSSSFLFLLKMMQPLVFYYLPVIALIIYAILKKSFRYERYGVFFTHLLIGLPFTSFSPSK